MVSPDFSLRSLILLLLSRQLFSSLDTIKPNQVFRDGDILISKNKTFAFGFFKPGSSVQSYLGIWYNKIPEKTFVWVANRDNPINNSSGVLLINRSGNLVLLDESRKVQVWSTNVSSKTSNIAQLLDSGNLVLIGQISQVVAWQSFDYPTDTLLPNMKIGMDLKTGLNRFITSWRSGDDPGTGKTIYRLDLSGSPQLVIYRGSTKVFRTAPWPWIWVVGDDNSGMYNATFDNNKDEISEWFTMEDPSIVMHFVVDESGSLKRLAWDDQSRQWNKFWSFPMDPCQRYGYCGAYASCTPGSRNAFLCTCLTGYEPKSPRDWYLRNWSDGCVRKRNLSMCGNGEGFVKVGQVKLPDTSVAQAMMGMNSEQCKQKCLRICSCSAYSAMYTSERGDVCLLWSGELMDIVTYPDWGLDLHVRIDSIDLAEKKEDFFSKEGKLVIPLLSVGMVSVLVVTILCSQLIRRRKYKVHQDWGQHKRVGNILAALRCPKGISTTYNLQEANSHVDLPIYDLRTITEATNNFSSTNKLGQGGFGSVYRGQLPDGQEIAVKKLSKDSGQGPMEFANEMMLIVQLQHRNLVKLLGCCIHKEEKMLVYEYMPNKSLDTFLFDQSRKLELNWRRRYKIIVGIARGMMYLHQDSRLKIIHRDLKASNVLLDVTLNPKISDFGMAKIFEGEQSQGNTRRVVGTYGYMSPEYAIFGKFSTKSDVFSFGVLLLEIISGKRNNVDFREDPSLNLIGHVWDLWREERALEIVEPSLKESLLSNEVLRCVHAGLLCVQDRAIDRPTMSEVVFMLGSDTNLPPPKQPAFFLSTPIDVDKWIIGAKQCSVDEVTITQVNAR
ncbi:PAN/Apple domain [Dillenia turbinata]|uniref:Receptor-like serine/threonine-protein kinase n=1 Tax=Dillenia turbinata TaxID=194707 RepID=A0AAN8VMM3_9MAGN